MMLTLQYLYAFALFGGLGFAFLRLVVLVFRFGRHAWDVANRFGGDNR